MTRASLHVKQRLGFQWLLTPTGWIADSDLLIDSEGRIEQILPGAPPWTGAVAIPGVPNAHSHIFQRALSGRTEKPSAEDTFWNWRSTMYRLAGRIDAEALFHIARFAYGEMLASGFTSVAEFHYLHHPRSGQKANEMASALVAAASEVGIRLRLFPTLYQTGGFGAKPSPLQKSFLFEHEVEFFRLLESLREIGPGVAFHSLRAVPSESIEALYDQVNSILGPQTPIHIHIAEQRQEVEQCIAATGKSPVKLLMDSVELNPRWSLVHATHAEHRELRQLAQLGVNLVICPLTEATLGDGIGQMEEWAKLGGHLAIGSDANMRLDPIEELRWMEYAQRLRTGHRACLGDDRGLGVSLWNQLGLGGSRSLGLPVGSIDLGNFADLIVLDSTAHPLAGHQLPEVLDALVIGGSCTDIESVYVGGRCVARHGQWAGCQDSARHFNGVMAKLWGRP